VLVDSIAAARFEGPDCKRMAQVVNMGSTLAAPRGRSDLFVDDSAKWNLHVLVSEPRPFERDEEVVVIGLNQSSPSQISIKAGSYGLVDWHQSGLAKFCLANNEPIGGDVAKTEIERFRNPQTSRREQREKGSEHVRTERSAWSKPPCLDDQARDLVRRKDEGYASTAWMRPEYIDRSDLMSAILRSRVASKQIDRAESLTSVLWRRRLGRPFCRGLGPNVDVSTSTRESMEAAQQLLDAAKPISSGSAEGKI
jgi:hypothetical protein